MAEKELHYINTEMSQQVNEIIDQFTRGETDLTPQELLTKLNEILPINKMQHKTLLMRVEGYLISTDLLWKSLLKDGSISRDEIVKRANIRSMSHYQYITGSRTPAEFLKTRTDFYNDPGTALAKLKDDVVRLSGFMLELRDEVN
ncbi:hypothetical protein K9N50_00560 [bacterium]|nr:hypothetical protein [bacterium]